MNIEVDSAVGTQVSKTARPGAPSCILFRFIEARGRSGPPAGPPGISSGNYNRNPVNTTRAADYHTHGGYDSVFNGQGFNPGQPGYNWTNDGNEAFSPGDKYSNDRWGLPGFLGTPQGTTEEYIPSPANPGTGQVIVLNVRNCDCR